MAKSALASFFHFARVRLTPLPHVKRFLCCSARKLDMKGCVLLFFKLRRPVGDCSITLKSITVKCVTSANYKFLAAIHQW